MTARPKPPNPARSIAGGILFFLLAMGPAATVLTLASWDRNAESAGAILQVVSTGLMSAASGQVIVAAWIAGLGFALWLIVTEHLRANRRPSSHNRRRWQRALEAGRTVMIVGGGVAMIYGALAALYAGLIKIRPDVVNGPPLPLGFDTAIPALILGGLAYALGRYRS